MSKLFGPFMMILSVALILAFKLGFIFLLLAMLPSIVAYYIDGDRGRPTFKIVFASNFAATLPFMSPMIRALLKMRHYDVSALLADPSVWMFVYSGAAAGWCLIYLCRFIARSIVMIMYEYNIASLESFQKQLVEEWGPKIQQPMDGSKPPAA